MVKPAPLVSSNLDPSVKQLMVLLLFGLGTLMVLLISSLCLICVTKFVLILCLFISLSVGCTDLVFVQLVFPLALCG